MPSQKSERVRCVYILNTHVRKKMLSWKIYIGSNRGVRTEPCSITINGWIRIIAPIGFLFILFSRLVEITVITM